MTLRFKACIVCIREREKDVEMLGVGDVNSETQNTDDVEPPAETFNDYQSWSVQIRQDGHEKRAEEQAPGSCIMLLLALEQLIARVHEQDGPHQHNFGQQNQGGIQPGPGSHFGTPESRNAENETSGQEQQTGQHYRDGQQFEEIHQHGVDRSQQGSENAVRSGQPVDHEFQNLQVDNQEAGIDEEVKNGRYRSFKHFLLPEGNQQHILPALRRSVSDWIGFSQLDIVPDKAYSSLRQESGRQKDKEECDLLKHTFGFQIS